MFTPFRRLAAFLPLQVSSPLHAPTPSSKSSRPAALRVSATLALLLYLFTTAAHAVIVRGTVTDPLGAVVVGARVQLVQGKQVIAVSTTDSTGAFEIRSTESGRFLLLTSAATFTPAIGSELLRRPHQRRHPKRHA